MQDRGFVSVSWECPRAKVRYMYRAVLCIGFYERGHPFRTVPSVKAAPALPHSHRTRQWNRNGTRGVTGTCTRRVSHPCIQARVQGAFTVIVQRHSTRHFIKTHWSSDATSRLRWYSSFPHVICRAKFVVLDTWAES